MLPIRVENDLNKKNKYVLDLWFNLQDFDRNCTFTELLPAPETSSEACLNYPSFLGSLEILSKARKICGLEILDIHAIPHALHLPVAVNFRAVHSRVDHCGCYWNLVSALPFDTLDYRPSHGPQKCGSDRLLFGLHSLNH
jgi:hypothetical protein